MRENKRRIMVKKELLAIIKKIEFEGLKIKQTDKKLAQFLFSIADEIEEIIVSLDTARNFRRSLSEEGRQRIIATQKHVWTSDRRAKHSILMKNHWGKYTPKFKLSYRNGESWLVEGWDEIEKISGIPRSKIKYYSCPKSYNREHLQFTDKHGEIILITRLKKD